MPKIKGTRRIFSLRLKKHRQIDKNIDPTSINLSYSKACTTNIQIKHVFNFRGMKEIRNNRKRTSSQCSFEVRSIITRQNYHIRVSESKGHRNGSEDRQADPERERRVPSRPPRRRLRRWGSLTSLRGACYAFPVKLTGVIEPVVHFFAPSLSLSLSPLFFSKAKVDINLRKG